MPDILNDESEWKRTSRQCPEIAVACSVIAIAIKDMRSYGRRHLVDRIDATVWLASRDAAFWFDATGIDQSYALTGMGWPLYARRLLNEEADRIACPRKVSAAQLRLVRYGLEHFDMGNQSSGNADGA